jgi:hypothetical protein
MRENRNVGDEMNERVARLSPSGAASSRPYRSKRCNFVPSRHDDNKGRGGDRGTNNMNNILPHARSSECVNGTGLDRGGVVMRARHFPGRGMLGVYRCVSPRVCWYR